MITQEYVMKVLEGHASSINRRNDNVVKKITEEAKEEEKLSRIESMIDFGVDDTARGEYFEFSEKRHVGKSALYEILTKVLNKRVEELTKKLQTYEAFEPTSLEFIEGTL